MVSVWRKANVSSSGMMKVRRMVCSKEARFSSICGKGGLEAVREGLTAGIGNATVLQNLILLAFAATITQIGGCKSLNRCAAIHGYWDHQCGRWGDLPHCQRFWPDFLYHRLHDFALPADSGAAQLHLRSLFLSDFDADPDSAGR